MRAHLTYQEYSHTYLLQSDYYEPFVTAFKSQIGSRARKWYTDRRLWEVAATYLDVLVQLLQDYQYQYVVEGSPVTAPVSPLPMPVELRQAFDTLALSQAAPLGAAEAVYRFWAKACHPDHGGDAAHFQEKANAIQIIRRYLGDTNPEP